MAHAEFLNDTMTYNHETNTVTLLPSGIEVGVAVLNYAQYVKNGAYYHTAH